MTAENPTELRLSPEYINLLERQILDRENKAGGTFLPPHLDCKKPQKPKNVETDIEIYFDEDTWTITFEIETSGRCPIPRCLTAWRFDPEKGEWYDLTNRGDDSDQSFFEETTFMVDQKNLKIVTNEKKVS